MLFSDKLIIFKTKESLAKNNLKLLPKKFLIIYKILLKIPYLNDNIIEKIFNFYLLKYTKFDFSVPEIKDNRDYLKFVNERKHQIIDNILFSNSHKKIFLNIIFINKVKCIDVVKDIVIKITYLDDSKEILLNSLEKIFNNNYLSETFIEKIFQIFNYDDFKKYQILHKVPKEFIYIFIKNMNINKINQNLFLLKDKEENTVFHNILNYDTKISFIKPIWTIIKKDIKNELQKITNKKNCTIYDLMKKYNINLC